MTPLRRVIAIVGPTASGKTALALQLSTRFSMEVVSADARQVFRYLDVGTAKPTAKERSQCIHHCIDIVEPNESYSAAEYARDARICINSIPPTVTPVVVGGSGLYVRAALDGFSHDLVPPEPSVREGLQERLLIEGRDALFEELQRVDPRAATRYADRNPVRVIRALEFFVITGRTFSSTWDTEIVPPPYSVQYVGIRQERDQLYDSINSRCVLMWNGGLLEETAAVLEMGVAPTSQSLQTVGYTEAMAYLRGSMNQEQAIEHMQRATRNYAKRQLTWFRRDDRVTWFEGSAEQLAVSVGRHLGIA